MCHSWIKGEFGHQNLVTQLPHFCKLEIMWSFASDQSVKTLREMWLDHYSPGHEWNCVLDEKRWVNCDYESILTIDSFVMSKNPIDAKTFFSMAENLMMKELDVPLVETLYGSVMREQSFRKKWAFPHGLVGKIQYVILGSIKNVFFK